MTSQPVDATSQTPALPDLDDPAWLQKQHHVSDSWLPVLTPVAGRIRDLMTQLYLPASNTPSNNAPTNATPTLPAQSNTLRAFRGDFSRIRAVIVGQDPYPTPGDAVGLSFSVAPSSRIPRSLVNIFAELHSDLGVPVPTTGDLSAWEAQGVLLLNRVLTVPAGNAGGHRGRGWEHITDVVLRALATRGGPLVVILWGNDAAKLRPLLDETPVITSAHPSPLSARRGFFGSRPFSRANELLREQGGQPIDWSIQTQPESLEIQLF